MLDKYPPPAYAWVVWHAVTAVVFTIYIAAGFFANNGTLKGKNPILSIFWLNIFVYTLWIPAFVMGRTTLRSVYWEFWLPMFANAPFYRLAFLDPIYSAISNNTLAGIIMFPIFILLPSNLAALDFILKNQHLKRKNKTFLEASNGHNRN